MTKRKLCVVTSTRAEYGLLYWLLKEIEADSELELQLVVTGSHLLEEFGATYKEILEDFKIDKKVQIPLNSDSAVDISKAMGATQSSFAEAFDELKPDLLVVLGDRYEIFSVVSAAMIANIAVAHLHGGEITEGAYDEYMRHSITKMSHLHFCATEEYRLRIIQLGEHPSRVFNVGGLGIDNIKKLDLLSKDEFEKSIDFKLNKKNILLTFHPETLSNISVSSQFEHVLNVVDTLEDTNIIFTKANADTGGKIINEMIQKYVDANKEKSVVFASLGQIRYLSALRYVDAVVGNSSSGLLEVPSFKIATINIGDRQKGRLQAKSIINTTFEEESISDAFDKVYLTEFQDTLRDVINPYGDGGASKKIKDTIKSFNLDGILKKSFYDLGGIK